MNSTGSTRTFFGIVIVVIGTWLLLDQTGAVDLGSPWRWIPSFFILFALWSMITRTTRNIMGPVLMIVIAAFIQLAIVVEDFSAIAAVWWPVLIILVGMTVIFGGRLARQSTADDLRIFAAFGGHELNNASPDFRGGQLTGMFGGFEIDLREAKIINKPAVLDVTVLFGGGELHIPEGWTVDNRIFVLFGGIEDSRPSPPASEGEADLVITGFVIFGGLELNR